MQIQIRYIEWIEIVWTGWTFELDYYFFFMWLPEKHLLFSLLDISCTQQSQKSISSFRKIKVNQEISALCTGNLNLTIRMKVSKCPYFQWHLSRDTVTPQMGFSQHYNYFPEYCLTDILVQWGFSASSDEQIISGE